MSSAFEGNQLPRRFGQTTSFNSGEFLFCFNPLFKNSKLRHRSLTADHPSRDIDSNENTPADAAAKADSPKDAEPPRLSFEVQAAAAAAAASAFAMSPGSLGMLLGGRDDLSRRTLQLYLLRFDFSSMEVDDALRIFLRTFRLPGEAQIIDRIMEAFSKRYNTCNPGLFRHPDTSYLLAYSVVMLQTDAHSPSVRRKMTLEDWIRNNRELDDGLDLPRSMLESIYERVRTQKFELALPGSPTVVAEASADDPRRYTI
jgi:hypothetical protein